MSDRVGQVEAATDEQIATWRSWDDRPERVIQRLLARHDADARKIATLTELLRGTLPAMEHCSALADEYADRCEERYPRAPQATRARDEADEAQRAVARIKAALKEES